MRWEGTLEVTARLLDGVAVVDLFGKATAETHLDLRAAFVRKIQQGRLRFILNLSEASFIDSMVLGEVVACYKRAVERGGDIKLVVIPDGMTHSLLQLSGLDHVFQIYSDEREAAASFAASS